MSGQEWASASHARVTYPAWEAISDELRWWTLNCYDAKWQMSMSFAVRWLNKSFYTSWISWGVTLRTINRICWQFDLGDVLPGWQKGPNLGRLHEEFSFPVILFLLIFVWRVNHGPLVGSPISVWGKMWMKRKSNGIVLANVKLKKKQKRSEWLPRLIGCLKWRWTKSSTLSGMSPILIWTVFIFRSLSFIQDSSRAALHN